MQTDVTMIVLAAGRGQRFGSTRPKQYLPLHNRPILWHTLSRLHQHEQIQEIIPVIAPDGEELWQEVMHPYLKALPKVKQPVAGGKERQHSVFKALLSLNLPEEAWVGIHDGARPMVEQDLLERLFRARDRSDAIIPAIPASDTIKQINPQGRRIKTLDRETIRLAQTPQLFRFGLILHAHKKAEEARFLGTDDASLVEHLHDTVHRPHPIIMVPGSANMIKITHPSDQGMAERLLQEEEKKEEKKIVKTHIGQGFDVHRWCEKRPLCLGGIQIPHSQGLLGHSDADVLLHAIMDALLGAAGLGDIGRHFPDTDARYHGIDSRELLKTVKKTLNDHGWTVINLDATIICEKPKLAPYLDTMAREISRVLQVTHDRINIKATTTEGLGFTGRNEGVAAQAVVLLGTHP